MKKLLRYTLLALVGCLALTIIFFAIRQGAAYAEIEREVQIPPDSVPVLETTSRLEILPLYENERADENLVFGHGVSYLLRTDAATVLMDLGHNPAGSAQVPALQNLQKLGIDWAELDAIVISHPHPDHVGGIKAWQNQTVSLDGFAEELSSLTVYAPISMTDPGVVNMYSSQPTLVSADIATTGVIPFPDVFPLSLADPKEYEQALVVDVAGEGLILITGCGHPTLETLAARAEQLYGKDVVGVVGGLHYGEASAEEVQPHIQFLEARQPRLVALSPHDSGAEALEAFRSAFPETYQPIRVGEAIQFP